MWPKFSEHYSPFPALSEYIECAVVDRYTQTNKQAHAIAYNLQSGGRMETLPDSRQKHKMQFATDKTTCQNNNVQ